MTTTIESRDWRGEADLAVALWQAHSRFQYAIGAKPTNESKVRQFFVAYVRGDAKRLPPGVSRIASLAFDSAVVRASRMRLRPVRWSDRRRIQEAGKAHLAITQACMESQGRCTQRTLGVDGLLSVARSSTRHPLRVAHDDGGKVSCGSYGYRWTTTVCTATADDASGLVSVRVSRTKTRRVTLDSRLISILSYAPAFYGEICVQSQSKHWIRVDRDGRVSGVAVDMPEDLRGQFGRYEHGATLAACEEEIERKRAVLRTQAAQRRATARDSRAARLLARISTATARYDDARALGYCEAGILAWARSRGIDESTLRALPVELRTLYADPDSRARELAVRVAERVWATRHAMEVAS